MHSQSFLLSDVEGGGHVDESGKAVQVVTVGMREDGVCLDKRRKGGEEIQVTVYSTKKNGFFCSACINLYGTSNVGCRAISWSEDGSVQRIPTAVTVLIIVQISLCYRLTTKWIQFFFPLKILHITLHNDNVKKGCFFL